MADNRTTDTIPLDNFPRWAYRLLALACVCMGLWASSITLQYFEHGSRALESDASLQALAVAAALMFVASEMGAFALAALLSDRQLLARRWALMVFAACVLGLEVVTIVAVQMALTTGADLTQASIVTRAAGLQRQIDAVEQTVAAFSASADALRADKQVSKAMRASDRAATEQAKTSALYAELAQIQSQQRPTLVGLLGKEYALAYAVARGILVSLGGLVFFGAAGTLLRAARGSGVPAAPVLPSAIPAPGVPSFKQTGAVSPKNVYAGLAGAGALAALAMPMAYAVPAKSVVTATAGAAELTGPSAAVWAHATEEKQAKTDPASAAIQSPPSAAKPPHLDSEAMAKTAALPPHLTAAIAPESAKLDTGTTGKSATRYNRIRAAVKSGKLKPSMRAIQAAEGGGGVVVRGYLHALEAEGVIARAGCGFVRVL